MLGNTIFKMVNYSFLSKKEFLIPYTSKWKSMMLSEEVSGTIVDYENSLTQQVFTFIFISSLILDSRILFLSFNEESTLLVLVGLMG